MKLSSSSGLSADAKEFIPTTTQHIPTTNMIPPPLYPMPSVPHFYPTIPVFYSIEPYPMPTAQYQFRTEDFPTLSMKNQPTIMENHVSSLPKWSSVVSSAAKSPKHEPKRKKNVKNKKQQPQKTDVASVPTTAAVLQPAIVPSTMSNPLSVVDDSQFPALGTEVPARKSNTIPSSRVKAHQTYEIRLSDMFNALSTSTQTKRTTNENKQTLVIANPLDSRPAPKRGKERENPKPRKPTKLKRIINKELEQNRKQRQENRQKTHADQNDEQSKCSYSQTNTSASCTEEEDEGNEEEEESNDEDLEDDHQPTSQSQTPFAQQLPTSNLKQQIHDGTFREYCTQLIDRQLDEVCVQLLLTLKRFQDRKKQQFQSNPERARRKRRFVHGIREVTKHLRSQRLKCVLIAPDCQSIQSEGGLNDAIEHIIRLCREQDLPFVFTLSRQKLGRCLNKVSRVSAIGIFDYSGAEQIYKQMIELTMENQRAYKQILEHDDKLPLTMTTTNQIHGLNSREFFKILHRTFQQQQQTNHMRAHIINHIPSESLSKLLPKVPAHHGHSRQTSDTSMIYIDPQLINSMKKQHTRASSGTFDHGHRKTHQRALSDGAAVHIDLGPPTATVKHSRTPSGCSAISQIEHNDYFEQTKDILNNSNDANHNHHHHHHQTESDEHDENRLKSIVEDTEDSATYSKRKDVERWINEN